jgi:hypothetical protein
MLRFVYEIWFSPSGSTRYSERFSGITYVRTGITNTAPVANDKKRKEEKKKKKKRNAIANML